MKREYSLFLAQDKQEAKQILKSKDDTNRAWQQSKELAKQQNSTQRLNDLNALSTAPLRLG